MAGRQPKSSSEAAETTSELATSIFSESLTVIREEIRALAGRKGRARRHAIRAIASLAKQAAPIAAEQRKAEKGELDAIRRLSASVIMAWIRQQTPEYRARLVREVTAIDARERKSVLG
jgi:hypothetical protein